MKLGLPLLSLYVGALFGDETIPHRVDVHAADVTRCASLISPVITPQHDAMLFMGEDFFDLEPRLLRLCHELLPKGSHGGLPNVARPIWRWVSVLEDAVRAHQRHHTVDIPGIQGVIEGGDQPDGCLVVGGLDDHNGLS